MAELNSEKDEFLKQYSEFKLRDYMEYPNGGCSRFYDNGMDMVIIDDGICACEGDSIFSYMLITDKQNHYIHQYRKVFRFLGYMRDEIDKFLYSDESLIMLEYVGNIADRSEQSDVSPLELHFEKNFSNVYGISALKYLNREYGICDSNGNNYFLDYLVNTQNGKYAVEENGVMYHHPQIIGEKKYKNQLNKQNTCALWGIKLFRFSTEDCSFDERIEDDIKLYFGKDTESFIDDGIKIERKVELYEHQSITLEEIHDRRKRGIKAFLIVLPTAAGKSKIVEEDIISFMREKPEAKILILVPSVTIMSDWNERIKESLFDFIENIDVVTYAYMSRHYSELDKDYYSYVAVDEAHHAVAPVLKRVIQYFDADFTVGLTATDQRPDKVKLETVFGSYSTSLSLKEAMEKEVVARANVYRLETNIDLSKVRFNGKDYVNADLEKSIRVTSRNDLIVDVINEYFAEGEAGKRQGVVFCVNVAHANEMSRLLNDAGIRAESITGQTRNVDKIMNEFKNKEIRFLCSCNMINEGWDYPDLGILIMARPTLSKVLYLQQIGRGLRKTKSKNNVIIIDVVDEYGAMIKACSMHAIFENPYYVPFGDVTRSDYVPGEIVIVDGIHERIEKIQEIDIDTFESRYGDYLSVEQIAREFFVSTGTITSWIRKGKINPTVEYSFGNKKIGLFSPDDVKKYRSELKIKEHNDETIKQDFFDFLEERDYSLSYKIIFTRAFINNVNSIGDAEIENILTEYINFYQNRVDNNLVIDRSTCPYNAETLKDRKAICRSMLTNPFEKYERKRFLYYSKDLGVISMNHALFAQMTDSDWDKVRKQMEEDLDDYYSKI